MTENQDIGKLVGDVRSSAEMLWGEGYPSEPCKDAADLLESLQPFIDQHGIEGVKQLCEAGEKWIEDRAYRERCSAALRGHLTPPKHINTKEAALQAKPQGDG